MSITLTLNQQQVIAELYARDCPLIASNTERLWSQGQASYIDDRVLCILSNRRALIKNFKQGNEEARTALLNATVAVSC